MTKHDPKTVQFNDGLACDRGLNTDALKSEEDTALINDLFAATDVQQVDYTLFFRHLADAAVVQQDQLLSLFDDGAKITAYLAALQDRLLRDPQNPDARAQAMNLVNPLYIPRNHRVEEAL